MYSCRSILLQNHCQPLLYNCNCKEYQNIQNRNNFEDFTLNITSQKGTQATYNIIHIILVSVFHTFNCHVQKSIQTLFRKNYFLSIKMIRLSARTKLMVLSLQKSAAELIFIQLTYRNQKMHKFQISNTIKFTSIQTTYSSHLSELRPKYLLVLTPHVLKNANNCFGNSHNSK